jgi:hypothetical protein
MTRAPRYHASGGCIHADPLSVISPAGRTFSIYSCDTIEHSGLIAAGRNGLVFYDNDRERFLPRPVFPDILSSHPTPRQLTIINEFSKITTWEGLRNFFIKLDKVLVVDQFTQYRSDPEMDRGHRFFVSSAALFCEKEEIPLRKADLEQDSGFDKLVSAISNAKFLKQGFFLGVIPDILQEAPDALLVKSKDAKRAERWLAVAGNKLPTEVSRLAATGRRKPVQRTMLQEVVAKYMQEMEAWENIHLLNIDGGSMSRRDAEEYLFGGRTAYCPSPLGFTPRLRFAFPAPEALAAEPLEIKTAFVFSLETKLHRILGLPIKLFYMQEMHCFLLESIGDGSGALSMAYSDGNDFEQEILFASDEKLTLMTQTVSVVASSTAPELAEQDIEDARRFIADQRESAMDDQVMETEPDDDAPGEDYGDHLREEM